MTQLLRTSLTRGLMIVLLILLGSCSMLRMSYHQGPQLAWWWLDGYLDFEHEQIPQAKEAIRHWFDWHRGTQLPHYAAKLTELSEHINDTVTSDEVCGWYDTVRHTFTPALNHAVQLGAPLTRRLSEAQLRHLEQRYDKNNEEFRGDYLQPTLESRQKASIKRTIKRFENLYGDMNDAQQRLIADTISASPFDPEAWLRERQRRQSETVQQLRQLISEPAETDADAETVLHKLAKQLEHSPNAVYRAYQMKLTDYNCAFVADLHNSTNAKQRRHARDKLRNWAADLHALAQGIR